MNGKTRRRLSWVWGVLALLVVLGGCGGGDGSGSSGSGVTVGNTSTWK